MPDFKGESPRRKVAQIKKMQKKVAEGEDIVAMASGAKNLFTFDEALQNHDIAKLFAPPKRERGRPTKYEPEWMIDAVLEVGRFGGSKEKMAVACRISKETLYEWMEQHKEFSDAVKEATDLSQVWWENAGQSGMLGMVEGFNSSGWQFNMKTRFPDNYREVRVTELNNTGAPLIDARSITINARELDPEYRESLKMALLAAKRAIEGDDDE